MAIYKEAQNISFSNPEALAREFGRMGEGEFKNYLSTLSQIHEDMQSGQGTLEKVLSDNIDDAYHAKKFLNIINSIGSLVFSYNSSDEIIEGIRDIRSAAGQQTPTGRGEAPAQPAETEGEDTGSLLYRIKRAKALDYSIKNEDEGKEVQRMLDALDSFYNDLRSDATPQHKRGVIYDTILEILSDLEGIYNGDPIILPEDDIVPAQEEEGEKEEEALEEDEDEGVFFEGSKLDPSQTGAGISLSDDEKTLLEETEKQKKNIATTRTKEEASSHEVFADAGAYNEYFDLTQEPPVFNDVKYETVYNRTIQYFNILFTSVTNRLENRRFTPQPELVKEFNDFMFSIKTVEAQIKEDLIDLKNAGKIEEEDYRRLYSEIGSNLVSARISNDEDLFENKILIPLVYMGNPVLARAVFFKGGTVSSYGLEDFDKNTVKDAAKDMLKRLLYPKFKKLLDPSHAFYNKEIQNFINNIRPKYAFLAELVKRELRGKPAYQETVFCPTCSKEITWTHSKAIRESEVEVIDGVIKGKRARGFELPIYSIFKRLPEPGKVGIISIEDLLHDNSSGERKDRKFPPPSPDEYRSIIEKRITGEYSGNRTWGQINEMIYSNDRKRHEEGWHRRSAALKHLGEIDGSSAIKLGKPIFIRGIMSECPYQTEGSFCGLSYDSAPDTKNLFNLQPTESFSDSIWKGKNIEDRDLRKSAVRKTSGGYKFSRLVFSCPVHWSDVDSKGVEQKHFKVAVSNSGPATATNQNYVGPGDGRTGAQKAMPEGTMSYLVCGAPTSISSFDRDPLSHGYIINVLAAVRNTNSEGYYKVVNYLIRNGIDVNDILHIESKIKEQSLSVTSSDAIKTPERKKRMQKIAELISQAAVRVNSEEYDILKNIMLICPHGHRFTVGHSIEFNETHAGMTVRKSFAANKKIFESTGINNMKSLIENGYLIKASKIQKENRNIYSEWDRSNLKTLMIPVTEDDGTVELYVFNPSKRLSKNVFRVSNTDYPQSHDPYEISRIIDEDIVSDLRKADLQRRNKDGDRDIIGVETINAVSLGQKLGQSERPPEIKGLETTDDLNDDVLARVPLLARSIKGTLNIIQLWTKGVANSDFAKTLAFTDPAKISVYSKDLARQLIVKGILRYVFVEIIREKGSRKRMEREEKFPQELVDELGDSIAKELTRVTNFYGFFKNSLNEKSAPNIVGEAVLSIVLAYIDREDLPAEIDFGRNMGEEPVVEFVKSFLAKNEEFIRQLTSQGNTNVATFVKKDYVSRIYQFSTALYLSEVLVGVYNNFLSDRAIESIGYEIGIDLSSVDKILNITDDQIENITTVLPRNYFYSPAMVERLEPMARNIDMAFSRLRNSMASARSFSASPAALTKAKTQIINRIDDFIPEEDKDYAYSIFDAAFPVRFMNFDDSLKPKNFIPLPVSKNKAAYLVPGSLEGTVEEGGVRINESINYRSDRFQVGMVGPKPSKMKWPIELKDGFVGMLLPFPLSGSVGGLSKLSNMPVVDFSILVDANTSGDDPSPLDISPFFMRGRNEEQNKEVDNIFGEMKEIVLRYKGAIEKARNDEARKELVDSLNGRLRDLHSRLRTIPPRIRTKRSILKFTTSLETGKKTLSEEAYAAMTLVDPRKAIDIIEHPFLMVPDYDYKPNTAKIKDFIIGVYKLDLIAEIIQDASGEEVTLDNITSSIFHNKVDSMPKAVRNKIDNRLNSDWKNSIGIYYDIIPNETAESEEGEPTQPGDKNTGSYLSYMLRFMPDLKTSKKTGKVVLKQEDIPEGHPSITEMETTTRKAGNLGLFESNQANSMLKRIPDVLVEYLDASTVGEFEKDSSNKESSEIINKIAKRKRELERTILTMGLDGLYID